MLARSSKNNNLRPGFAVCLSLLGAISTRPSGLTWSIVRPITRSRMAKLSASTKYLKKCLELVFCNIKEARIRIYLMLNSLTTIVTKRDWRWHRLRVSPMRGMKWFGVKGKLAPRYIMLFPIPNLWTSHSIPDTWHPLLSWGVYSYDSVLSRFDHDKSHYPTDSKLLHHSKPCSNHSIEPHHGHLTSLWMEDQHSQHSTHVKLNIINMETLVRWLKNAGLSITTNHKNPILKHESLGNQLMHTSCVYYREKAYWNKTVKGHSPWSPAGCCSKSWKSSSWRFSKSLAYNDSDWKQAITNK
jgi:hypothetical protein